MTYMGANDIKVLLESVSGRQGWFWMTQGAVAATWDKQGDDPLLLAKLEHFDRASCTQVDFRLTPAEWARIVAKDGANDLLRWTGNGLSLRGAVVAALNDIDADALMGGVSALEASIDRLVTLTRAAEKVCAALSNEAEATRERCHLAELHGVLESQR